jgi:hypothetical protein
MATYSENLVTIRDGITAKLAAMSANPKPNYSIDGESMSWQSLFDSLVSQLDKINAQIQMADGGFEVRTQGIT